MYRPGHVGAALLAYAPLGSVTVALGAANLALLGGAAAVGLAMLPDWDQKITFLPHRGATHSVTFLAIVAAALAVVGLLLGFMRGVLEALGLGVFGASVGALTIGSHIAADSLTPAGVEPFGDGRHYSFDVANADSLIANYALLALGGVAAVLGWIVGTAVGGLI